MKLSDLDPNTISVIQEPSEPASQGTLKLSNLNPKDVRFIASSPKIAEYGTPSQQALAGAEALAKSATGGASSFLTPLYSSPEAVKAREEVNPETAFMGNVLGGAALYSATGGFGGVAKGITNLLGPGLGSKILAGTAESLPFAATNIVSDLALGDPALNGDKILAEIGMAVAVGAGFGAISHALGMLPAVLRRKPVVPKGLPSGQTEKIESAIVDTPLQQGKVKSLEEMEKAVKEAKKIGGEALTDLPQKPDAIAAAERVNPSLGPFAINDLQLDSLGSQTARNDYRRTLQFPGENGEILRTFQGIQKKTLLNELDQTIEKQIAPHYVPTSNAIESAERITQAANQHLDSIQEALKPAMAAIKATPLEKTNHLGGIIDYLINPEVSQYANPAIADMFHIGGEKLVIKPFSDSMGIDKQTYRHIKSAIHAVEENPDSFQKLFNIRKNLASGIDVQKTGQASKELTRAKAAMMDYIQDSIQKVNPDLKVRETFKQWAKTEQAKDALLTLGIDVESRGFRGTGEGAAERVLNNIFSNTSILQTMRNILPDKAFNEMVADYMHILRNDATHYGAFLSGKFSRNLTSKQYVLNQALKSETNQNIKDLTTLLRLFPDDELANPSKTAQTIMESLAKSGLKVTENGFTLSGGMKKIFELAKQKLVSAEQIAEINAKLSGIQDKNLKLSSLGKMLKVFDNKMISGAKDILINHHKPVILNTAFQMSDKKYEEVTAKLKDYYNDPKTFVEDMADSSEHLYDAAPNITQSMQAAISNALSFLFSKIPQSQDSMPLAPEFKPSKDQKAQFSKYYQAVNDPLGVLKQVANGTLTDQAMEALQATQPQLLNDMRQSVIRNMDLEKLKKFPYAQRMALARFLGQPLDANMTPQAIQSNQSSYIQKKQNAMNETQSNGKSKPKAAKLKLNQRIKTAGSPSEQE